MSKELEAFERIKNITYDRTDLYGIEVFREDLNIIERALQTLELFKNAITAEYKPYQEPAIYRTNEDGSVEIDYKVATDFIAHKLDEQYKEEFTKWIIDNIDKDKVKEWLNIYE